jgi:hypothetical protein
MAALADISIEFAHLYLPHVDEERAAASASLAARWLLPLIAAYEESGAKVSTVVMVDDYFSPEEVEVEVEEKAVMLKEACVSAGLRVDHVAYESACAESVERMRSRLRQEPRKGDGSSKPPTAEIGSGWLSNGDPPRGRQSEPEAVGRLFLQPGSGGAVEAPVRAAIPARGHHSIHLDVQLWKDGRGSDSRLWACPTLAAWWQLIRLGMLRDEQTGAPVAPPRTQSSPDAPPLAARRTITLLDNRFLEVEHAVRAIHERLSLPEAWRRYLREGERSPGPYEHLDRIAYLFVPTSFESAVSRN